jgi:enamine deaminase RidA (YjgF/YER057c/UK114 family)
MVKRLKSGPRMSQAVIHGDTVYLAGQVADDFDSSLEQQTKEVLAKIDGLLKEAGLATPSPVVDDRAKAGDGEEDPG